MSHDTAIIAARRLNHADVLFDRCRQLMDSDDLHARFFFRRSYTGSYAIAALPAISVPCGFTSNGLPIGVQMGARPFAEETMLRVAHAYEQATSWHRRRAPVALAA